MREQFTIAAVLAITPLVILPSYFFYYDVTPKVTTALLGAAIGLWLFLHDSSLREARRLWADGIGRWFCLLAAAQVLSLLVSTFFSSHPELSWNGGNWRRFGFVSQSAIIVLAFLIVAACRKFGLRLPIRAAAAAGILAALYGILQYSGVDPFLPPASYHVGEGVLAIVRPPSSLGHADYFAGYLLYVVFFGAALLVTESRTGWKALGAAAAITGSAAIVLSGTRGALAGLGVGAISLWIWNRPRLTRRHVVIAVLLCVLSLGFYFSPAGLKLRARGQWELEDARGGARLWLWRDSLRMARERWLVGFGPETFGLEFPRYQSAELSRAYPDFYHESPHNMFLDALVSEGIPGLLLLAGFVTLAGFAARRAVGQRQPAAACLAAALAAGLTAGLFVCFTLTGALFFYATIAMLAGLAIPQSASVRVPLSLGLRVSAFALSLMAIAVLLYFTIRLTASDAALARAKRTLDAGQIAASLAAYTQSQHWHAGGSSDDLYFSRALAMASQRAPTPALAVLAAQQAFRDAQRAAETSEDPQNAWYNLAAFYAARNDSGNVEACLRRSEEASPNWFKSHWALAQVLLLSGRQTEALEEAGRAAELDGGKNPEVAKFLQTVHHTLASPKAE